MPGFSTLKEINGHIKCKRGSYKHLVSNHSQEINARTSIRINMLRLFSHICSPVHVGKPLIHTVVKTTHVRHVKLYYANLKFLTCFQQNSLSIYQYAYQNSCQLNPYITKDEIMRKIILINIHNLWKRNVYKTYLLP